MTDTDDNQRRLDENLSKLRAVFAFAGLTSGAAALLFAYSPPSRFRWTITFCLSWLFYLVFLLGQAPWIFVAQFLFLILQFAIQTLDDTMLVVGGSIILGSLVSGLSFVCLIYYWTGKLPGTADCEGFSSAGTQIGVLEILVVYFVNGCTMCGSWCMKQREKGTRNGGLILVVCLGCFCCFVFIYDVWICWRHYHRRNARVSSMASQTTPETA